jgi:hypothetical protein
MRGGGRSNSHQGSPGAESVRALNADRTAIYNAPETILNQLKQMTPDDRIRIYLLVNERTKNEDEFKEFSFTPQFRTRFNETFHKEYNDEALIAREIMVGHMEPVPFAGEGGKTRRNRRRRRNRRSLKRKHSRRR